MGEPNGTHMSAARFHGRHDVRVESVPNPKPQGRQILVKVAWCGLCGTDLHEMEAGPLVINTPNRPHQLTGEHLPITMGHELCGHIIDPIPDGTVSAQGDPLSAGDVIVLDPRVNCKSCFSCDAGEGNICRRWGFVGLNAPGGFANTVAVDSSMCHRIPAHIPLDHAALVEPLAVGRHALSIASNPNRPWTDRSVLVVGGGPIGFSILCNLRAAGARQVYVSEPAAQRREQTKPWATAVFNPFEVDLAGECRKLTDDRGVDTVFDCAGIKPGLLNGMQALKPKGTYVNVAGWESDFTLPIQMCMAKEITLKMSLAYDDADFAGVVRDFIAGKFAGAESMITAHIPLQDIVQKGFKQLVENKDKHVKILVSPRADLVLAAEKASGGG